MSKLKQDENIILTTIRVDDKEQTMTAITMTTMNHNDDQYDFHYDDDNDDDK